MHARWISGTVRSWLVMTVLWECIWLYPIFAASLSPGSLDGDAVVGAGFAAVWGAIMIAILTPVVSLIAFMITDVVRTVGRPRVSAPSDKA
jgi:hypothetical protein